MKTLDAIIADKILDLVQYVLLRFIKPDITVDKVTNLDEKRFEELILKFGIEGIILDVDETLRKQMRNIPKCNQDWIESLKGKLKIIILSNGKDPKIEQYFQEKEIFL